jgi:hypothetical protein
MTLHDESRAFMERITDGALDTIEVATMFGGGGPFNFNEDPERRRLAHYIAFGAIAHFINFAERADALEEIQAVLLKMAEHMAGDES